MNLDSDRPHGNIKIHVFGNLQTYGGNDGGAEPSEPSVPPESEVPEPGDNDVGDEPERFRNEIEI